MSWPQFEIQAFCRTGSGTTPSRKKPHYYEGQIPWVKSGELRETAIRKTEEHVSQEALSETSLKLVPPGALLVAMYGATVGRVGLLAVEATTNQAICHVLPDEDRADTGYMFHLLQAKSKELVARGVGGAQPNISQGTIKELKVLLPPLEEQRRIAAILDQADALRRLRRRALDRLNTLGQAIFHEMFVGTEYEKRALCDLGAVSTGSTPSTKVKEYFDGNVPFVTPGDLENSKPTVRYLTELGAAKSRTVEAGATLVCCIGTIGKMGMAEEPSAFNQQINAVQWGPDVLPEYGYFAVQGIRTQIQHIGRGASTTLPILKKSLFEKLEIPVAPVDAQSQFRDKLFAVNNLLAPYTRAEATSGRLFASLQHRAFQGEL